MPSNGYTLSIECILKEAKFRWLKGYEVLCILQNYQTYGLQLSTAAPVDPTSGSLFLFNKRLVKFRKDGVNWKKQKDGKTVRESHEKLKVGGVKVLSCCYTRSADNSAFQRRIYWLLDGDPTTVLVHYLLLEKNDGSSFHPSVESESEQQSRPFVIPQTRPGGMGSIPVDLSDDKEPDSTSDHSGDEVEPIGNPSGDFNFGSVTTPTPSPALNESLMDFVNSLISPENNASPVGSLGSMNNFSPLLHPPLPAPPPVLALGMGDSRNIVDLSAPPQNNSACLGRLAKIVDYSPEWDYSEGGAKVLITGPDFQRGMSYYVMFDQVEVQAEVIQEGVLRCRVPPHSDPGFVSFCVTRGNFVLFSEVKNFEYRKREWNSDMLALNERSFKLRIIERLERLEREVNANNSIGSSTLSQTMMESMSKTLEDKYLSEEQLEQVFTKILQSLMELLPNKEPINSPDKDGFTLLHCACALRYYLLAQTLISWGVNVDVQDSLGYTPWNWAMRNRDQRMIKLLVDHVDLSTPAYNQPSPQTPAVVSSAVDGLTSRIDGMDLRYRFTPDEAAITIQSAFRGWRVREEYNQAIGGDGLDREQFWDKLETAATGGQGGKIRAAIRQREARKEHEAAKKIQTAFKDYKTRRMQQNVEDSQRRGHDARGVRVAEKRK